MRSLCGGGENRKNFISGGVRFYLVFYAEVDLFPGNSDVHGHLF